MELSAEQRSEIAGARGAALAEIAAAPGERELEAARVTWLGKSGKVSQLRRNIGKLTGPLKAAYGEAVNEAVAAVESALEARRSELEQGRLHAELSGARLDVTLPGRRRWAGHRHPISRTFEDLLEIFARLGFSAYQGPEVELDFYNFEALAMPKDHPARDMQDTFYVDERVLPEGAVPPGELVLRTHTSPMQVRTMLARRPPLRAVMPGRVYRVDSDQTHSPMFHQIEGLHVDRGVTFAELKGTLDEFARALFGPNVRTRFRPSYFPFTEPSAEVDVSCVSCAGTGRTAAGGCRVCKGTGFLEVLGAGMVDPDVFASVGYDPEELSGFAFGLGVERIAMLRYGVDDLRLFFENDVRFLSQFP
jgi:phenylalanyl-tRNA synthetase alpha chain